MCAVSDALKHRQALLIRVPNIQTCSPSPFLRDPQCWHLVLSWTGQVLTAPYWEALCMLHVHICISMYVHMSVIHMRVCVYTYVYIQSLYVCECVCLYAYKHREMCMYLYIYTYLYVYVYINIHIHLTNSYSYTYTCICELLATVNISGKPNGHGTLTGI